MKLPHSALGGRSSHALRPLMVLATLLSAIAIVACGGGSGSSSAIGSAKPSDWQSPKTIPDPTGIPQRAFKLSSAVLNCDAFARAVATHCCTSTAACTPHHDFPAKME